VCVGASITSISQNGSVGIACRRCWGYRLLLRLDQRSGKFLQVNFAVLGQLPVALRNVDVRASNKIVGGVGRQLIECRSFFGPLLLACGSLEKSVNVAGWASDARGKLFNERNHLRESGLAH
jgi:hypothetical protein